MEIFNTNRTLSIILSALRRVQSIVHDPTIADTIEGLCDASVEPQYAGYLDDNHPENIEEPLKNDDNHDASTMAILSWWVLSG